MPSPKAIKGLDNRHDEEYNAALNGKLSYDLMSGTKKV